MDEIASSFNQVAAILREKDESITEKRAFLQKIHEQYQQSLDLLSRTDNNVKQVQEEIDGVISQINQINSETKSIQMRSDSQSNTIYELERQQQTIATNISETKKHISTIEFTIDRLLSISNAKPPQSPLAIEVSDARERLKDSQKRAGEMYLKIKQMYDQAIGLQEITKSQCQKELNSLDEQIQKLTSGKEQLISMLQSLNNSKDEHLQQIQNEQIQVSSPPDELQKIEAEIAELEPQSKSQEADIVALKAQIQQLEKEAEERRSNLATVEQSLEQQKASADLQTEKLQKQFESASDISALKQQLESVNGKVDKVQHEIQLLEEDLDQKPVLEEKVQKKSADIQKESETQISQLTSQLAEGEKKQEAYAKTIGEYQQSLSIVAQKDEKIQTVSQKLAEQIIALKKKDKLIEQQLRQLNKSKETLVQELEYYTPEKVNQIRKLHEQENQLKDAIGRNSSEIQDLEKKIQCLRYPIQSLILENQQIESEIEDYDLMKKCFAAAVQKLKRAKKAL